MFHYSRDRTGAHAAGHLARWQGILQADSFSGYDALYVADRQPGPIREAGCWAHARRKFFELADIAAAARDKAIGKLPAPISPIAREAVQRMDCGFRRKRPPIPIESGHAFRLKAASDSDRRRPLVPVKAARGPSSAG